MQKKIDEINIRINTLKSDPLKSKYSATESSIVNRKALKL